MTSQQLLVALDGSPGSDAALRWTTDIARALGADVLVVHSVEEPRPYPVPMSLAGGPVFDDSFYEQLASTLEEWCAPLRNAGVSYRSKLLRGSPAAEIMRAATDEGATLVVVGRRGHGGFVGLILGSVADSLAHHSPVPVVIIPDE